MIIYTQYITEAFVGQELLAYAPNYMRADLYYWQRSKRGSSAEIDYLIQLGERIIPIEVKSGKGTTLKSLHTFLENWKYSPYGARFSVHNYFIHDTLHSYPLYAIASFLASYNQDLKDKLLSLY